MEGNLTNSTPFWTISFKEQLIAAVRNHPQIWNTKLESFGDLRKNEENWKEIAESLNHTENCMNAYKRLRESFAKKRSALAVGKKFEFNLFDSLMFLNEHIIKRNRLIKKPKPATVKKNTLNKRIVRKTPSQRQPKTLSAMLSENPDFYPTFFKCRLIEVVKNHPLIWRKNSICDVLTTDDSWREVAEELNASIDLCKVRWHDLHQSFRRTKGGKQGSFIYYDMMTFLEDFINPLSKKPDFGPTIFKCRLIEAVQKHPLIWQRNSKSNFQIADDSWKEIAKDLNVSVDLCKIRWHGLRRRFLQTKVGKQGSFIYYDRMKFLENFIVPLKLKTKITPSLPPSSGIISQQHVGRPSKDRNLLANRQYTSSLPRHKGGPMVRRLKLTSCVGLEATYQFILNLIEQVQLHKELWDKTMERFFMYEECTSKSDSWKEIAATLNTSVSKCRIAFEILAKDYLQLRGQQRIEEIDIYSKYYKLLCFLDDFVEIQSSTSAEDSISDSWQNYAGVSLIPPRLVNRIEIALVNTDSYLKNINSKNSSDHEYLYHQSFPARKPIIHSIDQVIKNAMHGHSYSISTSTKEHKKSILDSVTTFTHDPTFGCVRKTFVVPVDCLMEDAATYCPPVIYYSNFDTALSPYDSIAGLNSNASAYGYRAEDFFSFSTVLSDSVNDPKFDKPTSPKLEEFSEDIYSHPAIEVILPLKLNKCSDSTQQKQTHKFTHNTPRQTGVLMKRSVKVDSCIKLESTRQFIHNLVNEVRSHKILWDQTKNFFSMHDLNQNNCWLEISTKLNASITRCQATFEIVCEDYYQSQQVINLKEINVHSKYYHSLKFLDGLLGMNSITFAEESTEDDSQILSSIPSKLVSRIESAILKPVEELMKSDVKNCLEQEINHDCSIPDSVSVLHPVKNCSQSTFLLPNSTQKCLLKNYFQCERCRETFHHENFLSRQLGHDHFYTGEKQLICVMCRNHLANEGDLPNSHQSGGVLEHQQPTIIKHSIRHRATATCSKSMDLPPKLEDSRNSELLSMNNSFDATLSPKLSSKTASFKKDSRGDHEGELISTELSNSVNHSVVNCQTRSNSKLSTADIAGKIQILGERSKANKLQKIVHLNSSMGSIRLRIKRK